MKTIDIIKKYYTNEKLEILDEGTSYDFSDSYVAVSLSYIYKYLLKEKITKKFVAKTLFKLCEENFLTPIPCSHAKDLVFCKKSYADRNPIMRFFLKDRKVVGNFYVNKDATYVKNFNSYLK